MNRWFRRIIASAAAVLVASAAIPPAGAVESRRGLNIDDYYRIQSVSEPSISPDGAWIAYVVTSNDREADEPRSAIWMVSWDGAERVRLTAPANVIATPRFSGDGRYVSYLTAPPGSETRQLMLLDRRGGEPQPVTSVTGEIVDYAWSPDGSRVLVTVAESAVPASAGKETDAESKVPKPIVIDAMHFKQDEDGYSTTGASQHLYLLELARRRMGPLTPGSGGSDSAAVWSADGMQIAFVRTRERSVDQDGMEDLEIIAAQPGAAPRRLARIFAPNQQRLAFSPDGATLAYLEGLEAKLNAYIQDRLAVVPVGGGSSHTLSAALDRAVAMPQFSNDGRSLCVIVEDDLYQYPACLDAASGAATRLYQGRASTTVLVTAARNHAVLASSDDSPPEVCALENGKLRPLTAHNAPLLADVRLGAVEELSFRSRDGTEVHGLLVKPADFKPGRLYPTVLWIHGGPNEQDQHGLPVDTYPLAFERQLLAAEGYLVLAVNYRGSSGRGAAFARAIAADWGHKEVEDLLAGIDSLIASKLADPNRLGIGGWSYGGILTDYAIATDTRFKAAVSGAGSGNQLSMYGSDEYVLQYDAELGPPWRNPSLWLKVSYPFFHADRIRTPTFFLGGEKDFNVPIAGGEQMYQALRTLGVATQLVVYPGQYHLFTRPSYIHDRAERVHAWYKRYLGP